MQRSSPLPSLLLTIISLCCLLYGSSLHALTDKIPFFDKPFPFEIEFENSVKKDLELKKSLQKLREGSASFELISQTRKAMRFDRDMLQQLLRAEGYYAARVTASILDSGDILYKINTGNPYLITDIAFDFPDHVNPPGLSELAVKKNSPLIANHVLDSLSKIKKHVKNQHCLFEIQLDYTALVNHQTSEARLMFTLAPSPNVNFGQPTIEGAESVNPDFLRNYFTFTEGDCFDRDEVEFSRLALLQSNLIRRANTNIADPDKGQVAIEYDLTERAHRTLKLGVGYDSDAGVGFTPGWEHRNLFHNGEKLEITTTLSEDERSLDTKLSFPHKWRKNQTLTIYSDITEEYRESYEETSGIFGINLKRPLSRRWTGSLGTDIEFSRLKELSVPYTVTDHALVSFPLKLDYLKQNDVLNPTKGWAIGLGLEPFIDMYETNTRFYKASVAASWYLTANEWKFTPTLATRVSMGSINGEGLVNVPIDQRYYVGGGGSVRGYPYQMVGLLDDEDNPTGGRSFGESSVELRFRFSPSWGAVLFVDGGVNYANKLPSFGEDFQYGAGFGVRYFTSFAPIRFDVATPLDNPRDELSKEKLFDDFQIYISLGQAF